MKHLGEEDLVLHLYGEAEDEAALATHVEACARCRSELALLRQVLAEVDEVRVPERAPDYEARVWERIARELPQSPRRVPRLVYLAAAAAAVLFAAFLAGRYSAPGADPGAADGAIRERVLLVALGNHLEESRVLLLEVANRGEDQAPPLERDREHATELLRASRLYRQTAYRLGDAATADFLEELERLFLDLSQGPESSEARSAVRSRIEDRDLLFKLRVLEASYRSRERQKEPSTPRKF